jgi:hypothetical protein
LPISRVAGFFSLVTLFNSDQLILVDASMVAYTGLLEKASVDSNLLQ